MMQGISRDDFWKDADTITSVLVHLSILLGAIAAVIKFQVLRLFSRRYKSELVSRHYRLADDRIVFEADYTVTNTGERPIHLTQVHICLCAAKLQDKLLSADTVSILVERLIHPDPQTNQPNPKKMGGIFHIEAGERSIFTLRAVLTGLEPVTFVVCQLSWNNRRQPAPYIGMYVRDKTDTGTATARAVGAGG